MSLEHGQNARRETDCEELSLIGQYEAIANASRVMLDAARKDDWDEVGRQEERCRALIARLGAEPGACALPLAESGRRIALLRAMLADDAEIRDRSEPWLREVEKLLGFRSRPVV